MIDTIRSSSLSDSSNIRVNHSSSNFSFSDTNYYSETEEGLKTYNQSDQTVDPHYTNNQEMHPPTLTNRSNDDKASFLNKAISLRMYSGFDFNNTFNPYMRCPNTSHTMQQEVKEAKGLLDFTVEIETDLKILVFGDSVGIQFAQGLEESAGASFESRRVLRYSWGLHEGLFLSAPVRGGGLIAGWRCTGLLLRRGENRPLPNMGGGGWVRSDVVALLQHSYRDYVTQSNQTVGSLDVMIMRIPHGWMELDAVTEQSLNESVSLAHELFGVTTIIILTLPFINNVATLEQLSLLREKNNMIRNFSKNWMNGYDGVNWILTADFGRLTDLLTELNARIIGLNTNQAEEVWLLNQTCCPIKGLRQHIAQVCSSLVPMSSKQCQKNMISLDGMHWCMESIGGRLNAGLACLLSCIYRKVRNVWNDGLDIRSCEDKCNAQFMSLKPVDL